MHRAGAWLAAAGAVAAAALAACGGGSLSIGPSLPPPGSEVPLTVQTVASGLEQPWAVAFLPGGRYLVTERPGRLRIVEADGMVQPPVSGLPTDLIASGQGGLLDLLLAPDFAASNHIYFTYAGRAPGNPSLSSTVLARARLSGNALLDLTVLHRQSPAVSGAIHYGGRIAFDATRTYIYLGLGDRDQQAASQQLDSEIGKVLRVVRANGTAPSDNPWVGTPGAEFLWSRGHRNIQGAALHPVTGVLWTHEHGPQGGDELNRVQRGDNYGWPQVSYGCAYGATPCQPIGGGTHAPLGFVEPVTHWGVPSTAPSGMAFYTGTLIPQWRGQLLVGALAGRTLWVLDVDGPGPVVCAGSASQRRQCAEVPVVRELNQRIRDVRQGPDGAVYLLTGETSGALLRIVPR